MLVAEKLVSVDSVSSKNGIETFLNSNKDFHVKLDEIFHQFLTQDNQIIKRSGMSLVRRGDNLICMVADKQGVLIKDVADFNEVSLAHQKAIENILSALKK